MNFDIASGHFIAWILLFFIYIFFYLESKLECVKHFPLLHHYLKWRLTGLFNKLVSYKILASNTGIPAGFAVVGLGCPKDYLG